MKTLNTYITEWKANTTTVSSIKGTYFIYKLDERGQIKIFDKDWPQLKKYKDKVYINGEHIELDGRDHTNEEFEPGIYEVEIKDIDNVTNCLYMFYDCIHLIEVPLFNTSKVEDMYGMFSCCKNIKEVPLFDTSNVQDMRWMFENCVNIKEVPLFNMSKLKNKAGMFKHCENLSEQTKKEWSQIYDFKANL